MTRVAALRRARALLLVASLATPGVALAEGVAPADATAAQRKLATDHFQIGKRALDARSFDKAIAELSASLDVIESPNARLELARALRDAGQLERARAEYARAAAGASRLTAKEPRYQATADAATAERAEIDARLAFVTVSVSRAPADATLRVGGKAVARAEWAAPVLTSPGAVDVVVIGADGRELARQTVEAATGKTTSVTLDLPVAPAPVVVAPPPPPPPASPGTLLPYAYVAGGVGVAGLAVFSIFGVLSNGAYNDLKTSCPTGGAGGPVCPASKAGEISDGKTEQTVANVGLAAGIVGVAAAATLFAVHLAGHSHETAALVVAPGYVGLGGSL